MSLLILVLKQVLPMVIGPLVTEVIKWLSGKLGAKLPDVVKILVSTTAGAVTAVTTGDVSTITSIISDAVVGGVGGLAGSKGRDVMVGKPAACKTPIGDVINNA